MNLIADAEVSCEVDIMILKNSFPSQAGRQASCFFPLSSCRSSIRGFISAAVGYFDIVITAAHY
jgi:hypothetical protein